jgi:hypothetical protein
VRCDGFGVRKEGSSSKRSRAVRVALDLSEALGLIASQDTGVRNPFVNSVRLVNCSCIGDRGSADDSVVSVLCGNRLSNRNVLDDSDC